MAKRIDQRLRKVKQAVEALIEANDPEANGYAIQEIIVAALDDPALLDRLRADAAAKVSAG